MPEAAHAESKKIISPGLKVFEVPPTDINIDAYRMVTIQPTTTGINPMEFIIPALEDHVDLNRSYFTMNLRLKRSNATNLAADQKLWVTNNLAHAIIKQIDLRLNGTLISPQSYTYHYKAYLETLMNYNREEGKTVLRPQGWFNALDFPAEWTPTTQTPLPMVGRNMPSIKPSVPTTNPRWLSPRPKHPTIMVERVTVWCFNLTWEHFTREAS